MALIFVYGTLMRGRANHAVLSAAPGSAFIAEARAREPRTLVDLGPYPAVLPGAASATTPTSSVHGELWQVDDAALRDLDDFEGCPDLFVREQVALVLEDGRTAEAFVYVLARRPPKSARVIPTGRYAASGAPLPKGAHADQIEEKLRRT